MTASGSQNLIPEMSDASALNDFWVAEPDWRGREVVEEPDALPHEDGDEFNHDLVQQAGVEASLGDGGTRDGDIAITGNHASTLDGALDSVGYEGE